jgi:periplasmic divalent cation tolerance protein
VGADADSTVVLLLTTLGAEADAAAIARTLIDERLAACVHVLPPMTSFYRWQGTLEEDREQQLVMKTTRERAAALAARVAQLHPYELPEVIRLEGNASASYASWVRASLVGD